MFCGVFVWLLVLRFFDFSLFVAVSVFLEFLLFLGRFLFVLLVLLFVFFSHFPLGSFFFLFSFSIVSSFFVVWGFLVGMRFVFIGRVAMSSGCISWVLFSSVFPFSFDSLDLLRIRPRALLGMLRSVGFRLACSEEMRFFVWLCLFCSECSLVNCGDCSPFSFPSCLPMLSCGLCLLFWVLLSVLLCCVAVFSGGGLFVVFVFVFVCFLLFCYFLFRVLAVSVLRFVVAVLSAVHSMFVVDACRVALCFVAVRVCLLGSYVLVWVSICFDRR